MKSITYKTKCPCCGEDIQIKLSETLIHNMQESLRKANAQTDDDMNALKNLLDMFGMN